MLPQKASPFISTDLDKLVAEHMVKSTDPSQGKAMWSCIDCGKTSRLKNDMSKHVEAQHIIHPGLMCEFCEKVLKTRDTLKTHMKIHTQKGTEV